MEKPRQKIVKQKTRQNMFKYRAGSQVTPLSCCACGGSTSSPLHTRGRTTLDGWRAVAGGAVHVCAPCATFVRSHDHHEGSKGTRRRRQRPHPAGGIGGGGGLGDRGGNMFHFLRPSDCERHAPACARPSKHFRTRERNDLCSFRGEGVFSAVKIVVNPP